MLEWLSLPAVWGIVKGLPSAKATVENYRLEWAMGNLAWLAFWNNGVRLPLKNIADGKGTKTDIDEISQILRKDEKRVRKISSKLSRNAQTIVATRLGMPIARALDMVVYKKIGPDTLRDRLLKFADQAETVPGQAQILLAEIDEFDRELAAVHEQLRSKGTVAGQPRPARAAGGQARPARPAPRRRRSGRSK